jgi:hypothetical protein
MGKYVYRIEVRLERGWVKVVGEQDSSLEYMRGRLDGLRDLGTPHSGYRLVRMDPSNPSAEPKVLKEVEPRLDMAVMAPAGLGHRWQPFAGAAARALRKAAEDVVCAARNEPERLGEHKAKLLALAEAVEALLKTPA